MSRPEHPEVAAVERCEFGFTEAFDDREHRRIDETDVGVSILAADFHNSGVVDVNEVDDLESTAGHIFKEACACVRV